MELQETARQLRIGMETEALTSFPGLSKSSVNAYVLGQMSYILAQVLQGDDRELERVRSDLRQSMAVFPSAQ